MAESSYTPDAMELMFQNIETEVRRAEDIEHADTSLLQLNNGFTSAIKFFGTPILPPMVCTCIVAITMKILYRYCCF